MLNNYASLTNVDQNTDVNKVKRIHVDYITYKTINAAN